MKITIDLDEMAFAHVASLSQTGLYGSDVEETVQALAMEALRSAFRAGFVPVAPEIVGEPAEEGASA
jgi:hypothetical protein